jgi:Fur family peroxide stress response transcriptional regulator
MRPEPRQNRMRQFEQVCRKLGLPLTTQRRVVFEAICAREDHPTADQIYDEIRSRLPEISRTTVYRILDTLVQTGMITKICHPGSAARFDPKIHQHHHLVCMLCERIIDIESPRMDRVPWPNVLDLGFEINDYHIHFRGTCAECRREQRRSHRGLGPTARGATAKNNSRVKPRGSRRRREP